MQLEFKEDHPIWQPINVLDKGFVRLENYNAGEELIVRAARVSYAGADKPNVRKDAGLIDYLIEHLHTSPLEQVNFTFHMKMPIFVHNQVVRHRTAKQNVMSARYSVMPEDFYVPDEERLQKQSVTNKQGSADDLVDTPGLMREDIEYYLNHAKSNYDDLLMRDLSKELSRIVLPMSQYTELYWQCDAHNLLHFLRLRLDSHAQYEIRVYAEAIYGIIKQILPNVVSSWENHVLNAVKFSAVEMEYLRELLSEDAVEEGLYSEDFQDILRNDPRMKSDKDRKINAFIGKLR